MGGSKTITTSGSILPTGTMIVGGRLDLNGCTGMAHCGTMAIAKVVDTTAGSRFSLGGHPSEQVRHLRKSIGTKMGHAS